MSSAHKVLVVEDDAAIRRGIVDALKFEGFGVFEAGDGERALDMALGVDCSLILLDLVLPDGLAGVVGVTPLRSTYREGRYASSN